MSQSIRNSSDFPQGDHLALITFGTISIPGDERSRQCPGHGYPAHNEITMSYRWYSLSEEEEWLKEIKLLAERNRNNFVALKNGQRVQVELELVVRVGEK